MKTWEIITTTAGTLTIEGVSFTEAIKPLSLNIGNIISIKTL